MIVTKQLEKMFEAAWMNSRKQFDKMFEAARHYPWDINAECIWSYFFTDTNTEKLLAAGRELETRGFRVVGLLEPSPEDGDQEALFLHVERVETHSPESLYRLHEVLDAFAEQHGLASYNGMTVRPGIDFRKPADLLIHIASGATPKQLETVWRQISGAPSPTGTGHSQDDGLLGGLSRYEEDGEVRIRLSFQPGTSHESRAELVARVLGSPVVLRTSDLEATIGDHVMGRSPYAPPSCERSGT